MNTIMGIPVETISAVAGAATAIGIGAAAWVAWCGLGTWRDEMKGRRKAELAEEVLAGFYQAQATIEAVRSPVSHPAEAVERPRADNEDADQARELDVYYVPIARLQRENEFFSSFFAKEFRFRAVFGDEGVKAFQDMRSVRARIMSASNSIARIILNNRMDQDLDRLNRYRAIIWEGERDWENEDGADAIKSEVDAIVLSVERLCRPAIEGRE